MKSNSISVSAARDAERLVLVPSPDEEPCEDVRIVIAQRIPADRLVRVPSPAEEPSEVVREVISMRME